MKEIECTECGAMDVPLYKGRCKECLRERSMEAVEDRVSILEEKETKLYSQIELLQKEIDRLSSLL